MIIFSGERAMENRKYDSYTPMKRLIEKLPSVAEVLYMPIFHQINLFKHNLKIETV